MDDISHSLLFDALGLFDVLQRIQLLATFMFYNTDLNRPEKRKYDQSSGHPPRSSDGPKHKESSYLSKSPFPHSAMELELEQVHFRFEVDRIGKAAEDTHFVNLRGRIMYIFSGQSRDEMLNAVFVRCSLRWKERVGDGRQRERV